jgi:hypothetical protein
MRPHRITRTAGLAVAISALAVPGALADGLDLVGPDARDAAPTSSLAGSTSTSPQDFRGPDAIDAASGRGTLSAPQVTVLKVSAPAPRSTGIDWTDVGIGAGGVLGIVLLGAGGTALLVRRPRRRTAAV